MPIPTREEWGKMTPEQRKAYMAQQKYETGVAVEQAALAERDRQTAAEQRPLSDLGPAYRGGGVAVTPTSAETDLKRAAARAAETGVGTELAESDVRATAAAKHQLGMELAQTQGELAVQNAVLPTAPPVLTRDEKLAATKRGQQEAANNRLERTQAAGGGSDVLLGRRNSSMSPEEAARLTARKPTPADVVHPYDPTLTEARPETVTPATAPTAAPAVPGPRTAFGAGPQRPGESESEYQARVEEQADWKKLVAKPVRGNRFDPSIVNPDGTTGAMRPETDAEQAARLAVQPKPTAPGATTGAAPAARERVPAAVAARIRTRAGIGGMVRSVTTSPAAVSGQYIPGHPVYGGQTGGGGGGAAGGGSVYAPMGSPRGWSPEARASIAGQAEQARFERNQAVKAALKQQGFTKQNDAMTVIVNNHQADEWDSPADQKAWKAIQDSTAGFRAGKPNAASAVELQAEITRMLNLIPAQTRAKAAQAETARVEGEKKAETARVETAKAAEVTRKETEAKAETARKEQKAKEEEQKAYKVTDAESTRNRAIKRLDELNVLFDNLNDQEINPRPDEKGKTAAPRTPTDRWSDPSYARTVGSMLGAMAEVAMARGTPWTKAQAEQKVRETTMNFNEGWKSVAPYVQDGVTPSATGPGAPPAGPQPSPGGTAIGDPKYATLSDQELIDLGKSSDPTVRAAARAEARRRVGGGAR